MPSFTNTIYQAGYSGTDDGAASASFKLDDASTVPVSVTGTVSKAGDPVTIVFNPGTSSAQTMTVYATQYASPGMIEFIDSADGVGTKASTRYVFSNTQVFGSGSPTRTTFTADGPNSTNDYVVCFACGTRILALRDGVEAEIKVEDLRIGDLAVTASGAHRPIRWIGRRAYSGVFANRNPGMLPIRFAAGSLGDNVPSRELCVSPRHAMVLDGMLVPAEHLVNGTSITRTQHVESLEYFHVELDSHDVVIAEGAESESYVEDDNRNFFHNAPDHLAANPEAVVLEAVYCLPRIEEGYALEVIRQRLAQRADDLCAATSATLHEAVRAA